MTDLDNRLCTVNNASLRDRNHTGDMLRANLGQLSSDTTRHREARQTLTNAIRGQKPEIILSRGSKMAQCIYTMAFVRATVEEAPNIHGFICDLYLNGK